MMCDVSRRWYYQNGRFLRDIYFIKSTIYIRFPHGLWNTYYKNKIDMADTGDGSKVDVFISIFSSQYANTSTTSWNGYVQDITARAKPGTHIHAYIFMHIYTYIYMHSFIGSLLFAMFMDADKVAAREKTSSYYSLSSADNGGKYMCCSDNNKRR